MKKLYSVSFLVLILLGAMLVATRPILVHGAISNSRPVLQKISFEINQIHSIFFPHISNSYLAPPFPHSPVIQSVSWDFNHLTRKAGGSDLWPVTWGPDDNLYSSWGDGGGFGGSNTDGWVSLGFARIEGSPDSFLGHNIWGGKNAENAAQFGGKPLGLLSVDGVLYAWIDTQKGVDIHLAWSSDLGKTWQLGPFKFPEDNFVPFSFLNFGMDYAGARDDFVYIYGGSWDSNNYQYLVRVPKDQLKNRSAYQFFQGTDGSSSPKWGADIRSRKPVFTDANGVSGSHVVYDAGIGRYLLMAAHHEPGISSFWAEQLGIFDAPEPWGPWTTVAYYTDWGGVGKRDDLGWHIPTKWISMDGQNLWVIFSTLDDYDSFNLVKATLKLK